MNYRTLSDAVGNTPLVRLARLPGKTSNVLLAKLEGNNPAGSVKDRPALSMIVEAEKRGTIKPGDTLIEATSGNTGIALAMVAAMRGYRMLLVMPESQTAERVQTMRAYGAELILTPKAGGMEAARDIAERMRAEGKGVILDQFANPDNPLAHYRGTGPEIWRDTDGTRHAFRLGDGHDRHDHGRVEVPEGKESGNPDRRRAARRRLADSRHPQMAAGIPAEDLRCVARRPDRERLAGRRRGLRATTGARGRHLRRHQLGRRMRRCDARVRSPSRTRRSCSSSAIAATATCPPACFPRDPAGCARRSVPLRPMR